MSPDELQQLLLVAFADQAKGQLETINWRLRAFETAACDQRRALLDEICRQLHNLKGAARSVELLRVEAMVHDLEDVLSAVREAGVEADASVSGLADEALDGLALLIGEATAHVRPQNGSRGHALPASTLFESFLHSIGALARDLSKEVAFTIDGGAFEIDTRVLDQLRAPLMHMVRNCVDHGVEDPETRVSAGKERTGHIVLAAWRRAAVLEIEVADDGAGIDVARVRAAAVERGVVTPEAAARMSEHEALWLIFQAGVSTRHEATKLSGRGVGLDVVRERVERLQGSVDVRSAAGQGTTFTLRVPLGPSAC